jgi:midasin (ATPase involved in ribosome maturation)
VQSVLQKAVALETAERRAVLAAEAILAAQSEAENEDTPEGTVMVEGTLLPRHPLADSGNICIPKLEDVKLVDTPKTVSNRRVVAKMWSLDIPLWLEGPSSAGKTAIVREVCARTGTPFRRFSCNAYTSVEELLGMPVPDKNDPTKAHFQPGPVLQAMINGEALLLDEMDLTRESVRMKLNQVLVDERTIRWPGFNDGKPFRAAPGFRIFAATNGVGMGGREQSSAAFRSRFVKVAVKGLGKEDLVQIANTIYPGIPPEPLGRLISLHLQMAEMAEEDGIGGIDANYSFTLRTFNRVCKRFLKYQANGESSWVTLRREAEECYAAGIFAPEDKKKVMELIDLAFLVDDAKNPAATHDQVEASRGLVEDPANPGTYKLEKTETGYRLGSVEMRKLAGDQPEVPEFNFDKYVLTKSRAIAVQRLMKSVEMGEPVFLLGVQGTGKSTIAKMIAAMRNQGFYPDVFDELTDPSVLIGTFVPPGKWEDGQLARALKNNGLAFQDEINGAPPAVIERQNGLLDGDKIFPLTEAGGGEEDILEVPKDFAWIGAANPGSFEGRHVMSRAFMNRVTAQIIDPMPDDELKITLRTLAERNGVPAYLGTAMVNLKNWVNKQLEDGTYSDDADEYRFDMRELEYLLRYLKKFGKDAGWEQALQDGAQMIFSVSITDPAARDRKERELANAAKRVLDEARGQKA